MRTGYVLDLGFGGVTWLAGWRINLWSRPDVVVPQPETAGQPVGVRHSRHIMRQRKGDLLGVAAADIEVVETHDLPEDLDHFRDPFIPNLLALFLPGRIADVFVIGLVSAHRVVRELEMRHDLAVAEDRGAGAGAERQHHLHPVPLDRAKSL